MHLCSISAVSSNFLSSKPHLLPSRPRALSSSPLVVDLIVAHRQIPMPHNSDCSCDCSLHVPRLLPGSHFPIVPVFAVCLDVLRGICCVRACLAGASTGYIASNSCFKDPSQVFCTDSDIYCEWASSVSHARAR